MLHKPYQHIQINDELVKEMQVRPISQLQVRDILDIHPKEIKLVFNNVKAQN